MRRRYHKMHLDRCEHCGYGKRTVGSCAGTLGFEVVEVTAHDSLAELPLVDTAGLAEIGPHARVLADGWAPLTAEP